MSQQQDNTSVIATEEKTLCCSLILQMLISGGLVVWEIFAIIALTNNSNQSIQNHCKHSNLWAALLTTCIITGINIIVSAKNSAQEEKNSSNILHCLGLGVFVWLIVEIFNDCAMSHLRNNALHTIAYIYFWVCVGILGVALITLMCGTCCLLCCSRESKEPLPTTNDLTYRV